MAKAKAAAAAPANKVRFGLSRLYRAKVNVAEDGTVTYGDPVHMPGAVSIQFTKEGTDPQPFRADDIDYYIVEGVNSGYSAELVLARLTDADRVDLLGEYVDENGIQYESTDAKPGEFAYMMEMQGNFNPIAFCFFNGKASRPDLKANTKGETIEVDTDSLAIRFTGIELPTADGTKNIVQGHMEKTDANAEKYEEFFKSVPVPSTQSADNGGSAGGTDTTPSGE